MIIQFSVIICTYNGADRINDVIHCILKQRNFDNYVKEIIVVDNNSNDQTKNKIIELQEQCKRIVYLFEGKQGLAYARKMGVSVAKGNWIIFIDDDNFMDDNWIQNAHDYILGNSNIGAFNGQVCGIFTRALNEFEVTIFNCCHLSLACTHAMNENSIISSVTWQPFGAGLVIIAQPLKELESKTWLKATGRVGDNLSSGEDTEMCQYVKGKGYNFGFCNSMRMTHLITPRRLTMDYQYKLNNAFAEYQYMVHKLRKASLARTVIRTIKLIFNCLSTLIRCKFHLLASLSMEDQIKTKLNIERQRKLLKLVIFPWRK